MTLWKQVTEFVMWVHDGQTRKYTGAPYATHPLRCGSAVLMYTRSYEAAIGMACHDGWEDQPERCTPELVHSLFGARPAELMYNLTSASKRGAIGAGRAYDLEFENRAAKKRYDREAFDNLKPQDDPYLVKFCKMVDRNDNLMDIDVAMDGAFAKQYAYETRLLLPHLLIEFPESMLVPDNDMDLALACYQASRGLYNEILARLRSIEILTEGLP